MNSMDIATISLIACGAAIAWTVFQSSRMKIERTAARSENEKLRQELEEARQERDRLLNALTDAFLLVDGEGAVSFANEAACKLFSPRKILDRPVREIIFDPRVTELIGKAMRTGERISDRVIFHKQAWLANDAEAHGQHAWFIDVARLRATTGGETTTSIVIRDVTAEHQTEQIRKDFVANASHELRTPLSIINGYLENLLDENVIEEPNMARHFLGIMRKHTDRITRIVEDMLMISRLESGEAAPLKSEPFPFRSCIRDVVERLEPLIHGQSAKISVVMPDEALILHGDRFYWTQVLFNLVENALKQNPHPGLHVTISCQQAGAEIHIMIADNGVGIPSADLPFIFRRFYRVEKHHSQREIKGTGLGLSIVKRAIEAHMGTITVCSVPGRETKFKIQVPAEPASPPV